MGGNSRDDGDTLEQEIVHEQFDPDADEPNTAVVKTIAELETVETEELSALYTTVDHILDHLFSEPPAPEAQAQITFTYEGYRITVHQDGNAKFVKVS